MTDAAPAISFAGAVWLCGGYPSVAMALPGGQRGAHRLPHFGCRRHRGDGCALAWRIVGRTAPGPLLERSIATSRWPRWPAWWSPAVFSYSGRGKPSRAQSGVPVKGHLVAAGLINVAIYQFWASPRSNILHPAHPCRQPKAMGALFSLIIWIAVAACGRSIAYF